MSKFNPFIGGILLLATSCKTIGVQQGTQVATTQPVVLGQVGLDHNLLIDRTYTNTAIPDYDRPLKLSFAAESFSKSTFKAFMEAKISQRIPLEIRYVDSLKTKPKFVSFQIVDRVTLIEQLNSTENKSIKDHLALNKSAGVITGISMALKAEDLDALAKSDAVYLVATGLKTYGLQLYTNGKASQTIGFNQGVVFAYTVSHCCWQEDTRHQLHIVDVVENAKGCPNKTYRNAKRAKTKDDYFKF